MDTILITNLSPPIVSKFFYIRLLYGRIKKRNPDLLSEIEAIVSTQYN